ncbi:MAG: hypothetical protein ACYCUM_13665 [Solirubrobacteraceae bacterium]
MLAALASERQLADDRAADAQRLGEPSLARDCEREAATFEEAIRILASSDSTGSALCSFCGEHPTGFVWGDDPTENPSAYCRECATRHALIAYGEAAAALRGIAQAAALATHADLSEREIAHGLQLGLEAGEQPLDTTPGEVLGTERHALSRFYRPLAPHPGSDTAAG